jgi:hypothetical protein
MANIRKSAPRGNTPDNLIPIRSHWKLRWLMRLIRLKNADAFSPAALDCAAGIADCFYKNPLAEVSVRFLTRKTGLHKNSVVRGLGELERTPDTVIVRVRGQWQGRVKNKYAMVLLPEDLGPEDSATLGVTGPVASDSWVPGLVPAWVPELVPSRVPALVPKNSTSLEASAEREVVSADAAALAPDGARAARGGDASEAAASGDARAIQAAFESFWAAYPRKEGRAAARKEFEAAIARGVPVETILDGARRYATAKASHDSNWLKFPATWLREECWTEDPRPPRPKPAKQERPTARAAVAGKKKQRGTRGERKSEPTVSVEPVDPEIAARKAGFTSGRRVWIRESALWGEVDQGNHTTFALRVGESFKVVVRLLSPWIHSGFYNLYSPDVLLFEDPLSPDERVKLEAEATERVARQEAAEDRREAERRREAEAKRIREQTLARFPVGSRVTTIHNDDRVSGRVLEVFDDEVRVDFGRWNGDDCNMVLVDELVLLDAGLPVGARVRMAPGMADRGSGRVLELDGNRALIFWREEGEEAFVPADLLVSDVDDADR